MGLRLCSALLLACALHAQQSIVVRPHEIDSVLVNPGIGFTTFQRFNGDDLNRGLTWTEGYPLDYQPFKGSLENRDYPATSIAYFRVYWRFIEPHQGEYRWDLIDKALATAHERKQTVMLRIAPYGSKSDNDVPDWFRALVGKRIIFAESQLAHKSRRPTVYKIFHLDGAAIRCSLRWSP